MKKVEKFRQTMAELGTELTPDEAAVTFRQAMKLRNRAKRMSQ